MISKQELRVIARARLKDAQVLLRAKRFDGAYYLGGYAVEVALKARICRTLKWAGFPDAASEFQGLHSLKTHDLEILLRLSGAEATVKARRLAEWSAVLNWNPEKRYQPVGKLTPQQAMDMVTAAGDLMITNSTLRKAMRDIAARKGDFTLFAKIRRADAPGTWDLVVSAPWLEAGKLKATSELAELLSDSVGESSLHEFSRIQTVGADHPTVRFMLDNLSEEDGELRVQSMDLFGLQIEEAVIFRAKKPATIRPSNRRMEPTRR